MAMRTVMLFVLFLLIPGSAVSLSCSDEKLADGFMNKKGLKILHQNVRGLLCNLPLIQKFLFTHHQTDIFCCSETHIKEYENIKNLYTIEGYEFVSRNRTNGSGGGVGIYIKNQLEWKRRDDLENESIECLWLEIFLKHTNSLLVGCYYKPPKTSEYLSKEFNTTFNDTLSSLQKEHKEVIFLGDFNANYLVKRDSKELKAIIEINGFEQMIKEPTRITETTETLIDLIATNNPSSISKVNVTSYSIADHELIGCVRKLNNIKYKSRSMYARNYKDYAPENLLNNVKNINWQRLYATDDPNSAANFFTKQLKAVFDQHAPFENKTVRGKPAAWLRADVKILMNNRDRILRKAKKTSLPSDWTAYKRARNLCNGKIREAKRKYYRNLIEENKRNPRKFWDTIKTIFPTTSKSSTPQMEKSKCKELTNIFSDYFSTAVTKLKSNITSFSNYIWRPYDTQKRRTEKTFNFSYVSNVFVEKHLSQLKRRKSTGSDDLPAGMIKDCKKVIAKPLAFIINLSLRTGVFPSIWKNAKITPVHKKGDTKNPENFRPISVLPIFSKIIEKAAHSQLSAFLERNELLTEFQFGYREKRSTKLASTLLFDNMRSAIDNGNLVGATFIDLTKAFDTVSHSTLLGKLTEYGIKGIEKEWMTNYLFNRKQVVNINGVSSSEKSLLHGVPQGSILGPLLFLIYFNDFPECLEKCNCIMYADDTVIYVADKNIEKIEKCLENDLERIAHYFDESQMIINLGKGKTETIIFGTGKRLSTTKNQLDISYRGQPIENVSEYKYLGNFADQHLSFNKNFESVFKKASGRLKLLKRLRGYLTQESALVIFKMMILPILTYRSTVKITFTKTQKDRLKSLQCRASVIVGQEVPSVTQVIYREACILVRKCIAGDVCSNFTDYFTVNKHSQRTRNSGYLLKMPRVKLELGKNAFRCSGSKLYNNIPLELRKLESFNLFIKEIKNHDFIL